MSLAGFMIYSKNILISKHNLPKFFLLTHTFMNWGWGRGSVGSTTVPVLHRVILVVHPRNCGSWVGSRRLGCAKLWLL